jgi:hypothetical protein
MCVAHQGAHRARIVHHSFLPRARAACLRLVSTHHVAKSDHWQSYTIACMRGTGNLIMGNLIFVGSGSSVRLL